MLDFGNDGESTILIISKLTWNALEDMGAADGVAMPTWDVNSLELSGHWLYEVLLS